MKTTLELNIAEYLSELEIKVIISDQIRMEVHQLFYDESNVKRILSNVAYQIIFDEVDKSIPNSTGVIAKAVGDIIRNKSNYMVFRDGSYGSTPSLAYKILEQAIEDNKELINDRVRETIINNDYSDEIWKKFEDLADTFISNIYSIVELGRKKP